MRSLGSAPAALGWEHRAGAQLNAFPRVVLLLVAGWAQVQGYALCTLDVVIGTELSVSRGTKRKNHSIAMNFIGIALNFIEMKTLP